MGLLNEILIPVPLNVLKRPTNNDLGLKQLNNNKN